VSREASQFVVCRWLSFDEFLDESSLRKCSDEATVKELKFCCEGIPMSRKTREQAAARLAETKILETRQKKVRGVRNSVLAAVALTVIGAIAYGSISYVNKPLEAERSASWDTKKVYPSDISFGKADAPVRITEYGSLTCVHCKNFHENHLKDFLKKYVDTGKVHFVFRHFSYDQAGLNGASFVTCLPPTERAVAVSKMMERQSDWVHSSNPANAAADVVGLEGEQKLKAVSCAADSATIKTISEIGMEASAHGVSSTPTFVIGNNVHGGFMGASALGALVEQELTRK
jgi:protein-disulfide isomerase